MHDKPQVTKRFASENTPTKKEAQFETAYHCALIDAELPLDELKSAGVMGAGFTFDEHVSENAHNAEIPLDVLDKERLRRANHCSTLYRDIARNTTEEVWSKQVGEVQAFTTAIMDVIVQILDTELKLDTVKTQ